MKPNLTERQATILDFIKDFARDHGYPPTIPEIQEEFNIKSPNGVNNHIKALTRKGYIKRDSSRARALDIIGMHEGIPVSLELPQRVTVEIVEADPVVKGQTASSSYKPAVADNGLRVMVPPHISAGTRVVIMTEDGKLYLSEERLYETGLYRGMPYTQ